MTTEQMRIVMVNWNLRDYTLSCIDSVVAAGARPDQVIVVDNGSTDGSIEAIRDRFPGLTQICNERNVGFTGGMNIGIQAALDDGTELILLLNNDTVLAADMLDVLIEANNALGNPGILGPAIYYYDDPQRVWRLAEVRHSWLPMPLQVRRNPKTLDTAVPFQVDYVTGCAMLISRSVFERIGLFDTRYFIYYDDADLCRRALDGGFSVWCVPRARMWHKVSLTTKRDQPYFRYLRARNQVRFYREHPHGPSPLLREAYIAFRVIKTFLSDVLHGDWSLIRPLWKGTADGYREQRAER